MELLSFNPCCTSNYNSPCFIPGLELIPVYEFNLKRVKEALRDGIIPAVALTTHASDELVLGQDSFELIPSVLTAAIGVIDKPLRGTTPQDRLIHRL